MEWNKCYVDVILVPSAILMNFGYHVWLWHRVRTQPHTTIIGINASGRRNWVAQMIKDNEKKNILAVQSLRNTLMGSTLMATTAILLCSGLAAVISSTYSVKKPLNDTVYGAHGEFMVALKYVTLLTIFLFSFFCHSLSITFINQVNILINTPQDPTSMITPEYLHELLEKGFILNILGNRLFYAAIPLLLWIFGPVLVFLCSCTIVPVLYNLDITFSSAKKGTNKDINENRDDYASEKRTAENAVYVPPAQQGAIHLQKGIRHAEEKDYKTAYSYFLEAFESFNALGDPKAIFSLKYMLLCKIMVSQADDIAGIISSKAGLQYVRPDLDAMKAVADAHSKRSLKLFEIALRDFKAQLEEDPIVHRHLSFLYDTLLEQNLRRLIEPFSRAEIAH